MEGVWGRQWLLFVSKTQDEGHTWIFCGDEMTCGVGDGVGGGNEIDSPDYGFES